MLAREVLIEADTPFDVRDIVRRLRAQQPGCFVYASDGFVGASPELLVRRTGDDVESRPVAGTTVADSDEALRALARVGQGHTASTASSSTAIVEALEPRVRRARRRHRCPRSRCSAPSPTSPRRSAAGSRDRHRARSSSPGCCIPTPAVGGTPRAAALDAIRALEGFDRGRYAGPGRLGRRPRQRRVGDRAARRRARRRPRPSGRRRRIVAGSEPDAEWAETQAKLEPMLRALVRP